MKILSWWSGGMASAVACKKILEQYDDVKIVFIDTKNEHPDTYRFLMDCEAWYDRPIETVTNTNYERIEMVWLEHLNLNYGGAGAVCSAELKRKVREQIQRQDNYDCCYRYSQTIKIRVRYRLLWNPTLPMKIP